MKLITQGAAYKQSEPLNTKIGNSLIIQVKELVNDCVEPMVCLKQLQGLYATCAHNMQKIEKLGQQNQFDEWQQILNEAESMLRDHIGKHPILLDIEHSIDIFCEPADDVLKKIIAERVLTQELSKLNESNVHYENPAVKIDIY
jgi:hypothetical protein